MITVDWIEFLRGGDFESIRLGMLGQGVKRLLGEEEDYSVSNHPRILKYGRLQIAFDENRVVSITVYFQNEEGPIWEEVRTAGWEAHSTACIEDFEEILKA